MSSTFIKDKYGCIFRDKIFPPFTYVVRSAIIPMELKIWRDLVQKRVMV